VLCTLGSIELVLWHCNNFYSNSVLFEVRNVVTSLMGVVIVSHLSPTGLGRFNVYVLSAAVFNGIIHHADCTLIFT
jgi:hypothetical protein